MLPAVFYFIGRSLSATPAQLGTLTLCRALVQVSLHVHCWLYLCIALHDVSHIGHAKPGSAQGATASRLSLDGLCVWNYGLPRSLLSALLHRAGAGGAHHRPEYHALVQVSLHVQDKCAMVGSCKSLKPVEQLCLATSQCCLCMQPLTKQVASASRPCPELSPQSPLPAGGEAFLHRAGCLSTAAGTSIIRATCRACIPEVYEQTDQ